MLLFQRFNLLLLFDRHFLSCEAEVESCLHVGFAKKKISFLRISIRFDELKARGQIPAFAPCFNSVDLTGSVTGEMYEKSLKILLEDREVDGVIVLALHHVPTLQEDFVDNIVRVSKGYLKPLVACDVGEAEMARRIRFRFEKSGVPAYPTPERASKAMYGLIEYGRFLRRRGVYERYAARLRSEKPQI